MIGELPESVTGVQVSGVNPAIFTAHFTAREAAKQLVLLEDHLAHPSKRCSDCISKHRLMAEAFAEEATTLDGAEELPWLPALAGEITNARSAPEIRAVRKQLVANLGGEEFDASEAGSLVKVVAVALLGYLGWRAFR